MKPAEKRAADAYNGQLVNHVVKQLEGRAPVAEANIAGEQELTPEQRQRLPYVLAAALPCLLRGKVHLCEGKAHVVNYWIVPAYLQKGRKDNVVWFSLCRVCVSLPGVLTMVSDELFGRVSRQKAVPKVLEAQ